MAIIYPLPARSYWQACLTLRGRRLRLIGGEPEADLRALATRHPNPLLSRLSAQALASLAPQSIELGDPA